MHKNWFKLLWQEVKVTSPAAFWMLPLFTLGGIVLILDVHADALTRHEYIAMMVEIVFPLGITFIANGIILQEIEKNTLAFVAVRSQLPSLWLRRLVSLLLVATLCVGILLLVYHFFYIPISIGQMLFAFLAVSLALIGASSVTSLALREMNAGYLIGSFWWALCLIGAKASFAAFGPYLYLFYLWFGIREEIGTEVWFLNKLALTGVGLVFILISLLLLRPTERFFT